jgi:hypothetical protein
MVPRMQAARAWVGSFYHHHPRTHQRFCGDSAFQRQSDPSWHAPPTLPDQSPTQIWNWQPPLYSMMPCVNYTILGSAPSILVPTTKQRKHGKLGNPPQPTRHRLSYSDYKPCTNDTIDIFPCTLTCRANSTPWLMMRRVCGTCLTISC